jgi:hypothetical protein
MKKFAIGVPHLDIDGAVAVSEKQLNEAASAIGDRVPLHRFGEAAEIGKAALFLASGDCRFFCSSLVRFGSTEKNSLRANVFRVTPAVHERTSRSRLRHFRKVPIRDLRHCGYDQSGCGYARQSACHALRSLQRSGAAFFFMTSQIFTP